MSRTADVVIVGGGVTGTSIAFHLARGGARNVLLLERNALASGGTGLSVGIVRQLYIARVGERGFGQLKSSIGGERLTQERVLRHRELVSRWQRD